MKNILRRLLLLTSLIVLIAGTVFNVNTVSADGTVVAEINGDGYFSLAEAVANVPDGGTIKMVADTEETGCVSRCGD